jgi:uncharacterized protein
VLTIAENTPAPLEYGSMTDKQFPAHMHEHLKHYVYLYRDPDTHEIFYVGEGQGNRAFSHLSDEKEGKKKQRIDEIRSGGREPEIAFLAHGLTDKEVAQKVEAAAIDILGLEKLTNEIRGFGSAYGLMTFDQIVSRYRAKDVDIVDPVCLVRPNRLFRYGMSDQQLYDVTRGIWEVNPKAHDPEPVYALSVFEGVVQEVYKIAGWFPAGSTLSTREELKHVVNIELMEFVGAIAHEKIRKYYQYHSVKKYLPKHSQSPVLYINC